MKKNKLKTFIIYKRTIIITLFVTLSVLFISFVPRIIKATSPKAQYTVVIDAGHGGIDGGSIGAQSGVTEASLNLAYAKCLKSMLTDYGFGVVMTRTTDAGLYSPLATNKKKDDMQKRKEIIEKANPDIVVSIHMNSFPLQSAIGAQVFYKKDNNEGKILADCMQGQLNKSVKNAKKTSKVGDYYMVNCTNLPAVLVECGYLSNKEEETLLQNKDYQNKFCYCLCCGIIDFLNKPKI